MILNFNSRFLEPFLLLLYYINFRSLYTAFLFSLATSRTFYSPVVVLCSFVIVNCSVDCYEKLLKSVVFTEGILFLIYYCGVEVLEVAVVQQVVYGLIRRKARIRAPGQASKQNTKSISSAISSQQISGKNSEV